MLARLAGIQKDSIVDGPGIRLALYFQGCSHRCPGCHNPETHDPSGGNVFSLPDLLELVDESRGVSGVTFSGGEPFEQAEVASQLAAEIKKRGLDIVLYSGYYFEDLLQRGQQNCHILGLLQSGRLLVDGPYIEEERDLRLAFRGSRNQRLIDLNQSIKANQAIPYGQ